SDGGVVLSPCRDTARIKDSDDLFVAQAVEQLEILRSRILALLGLGFARSFQPDVLQRLHEYVAARRRQLFLELCYGSREALLAAPVDAQRAPSPGASGACERDSPHGHSEVQHFRSPAGSHSRGLATRHRILPA